MNNAIRFKLFLMMVLEFFIWGAWLPLIFGYLPSLGFSPAEQSWILNAFPISAIIGMFFSNQFADRHFAAEKFLAFSHLIGGLSMIGLAFGFGRRKCRLRTRLAELWSASVAHEAFQARDQLL